MKTLIFIILKVLELTAALSAITILPYFIGSKIDPGYSWIEQVGTGYLYIIAICVVGLLLYIIARVIYEVWPKFIKHNRKLADKIYNKLK